MKKVFVPFVVFAVGAVLAVPVVASADTVQGQPKQPPVICPSPPASGVRIAIETHPTPCPSPTIKPSPSPSQSPSPSPSPTTKPGLPSTGFART